MVVIINRRNPRRGNFQPPNTFFFFLAGNQLNELKCHRHGCWLLRSQKKHLQFFPNKQWLLSIDMKTKVVQHVPRINLSYFKFQIFKFSNFFKFSIFFKFSNFLWFPAFVWLSDIFFYHILTTDTRFHRAGSQLKKGLNVKQKLGIRNSKVWMLLKTVKN